MTENKIIVNSWNEWDPLKHVIVGKADGTHGTKSVNWKRRRNLR